MEFLKALLAVAYKLGYDGLPPGVGGPEIDPTLIPEITDAVERFLIEELTERVARRG